MKCGWWNNSGKKEYCAEVIKIHPWDLHKEVDVNECPKHGIIEYDTNRRTEK